MREPSQTPACRLANVKEDADIFLCAKCCFQPLLDDTKKFRRFTDSGATEKVRGSGLVVKCTNEVLEQSVQVRILWYEYGFPQRSNREPRAPWSKGRTPLSPTSHVSSLTDRVVACLAIYRYRWYIHVPVLSLEPACTPHSTRIHEARRALGRLARCARCCDFQCDARRHRPAE